MAMDSESGSGWEVAASSFLPIVPNLQDQTRSLSAGVSFVTPKPRGRPPKRALSQLPFEDSQKPCEQLAIVPVNSAVASLLSKEASSSLDLGFPSLTKAFDLFDLTFAFSPLQQSLLNIHRHAGAGSQPAQHDGDDALSKFVSRALLPSQPLSSKRLIDEACGGRTTNYHEATAAALVLGGVSQWAMFLKRCKDMIATKKVTGLMFIKQRFYDETPLRLRVAKCGQNISKVLQTHFRIGIVLQNNDTKEIVTYFGGVPTWLQTLQDKRAESIMQAQMELENSVLYLDECSKDFLLSIQMITTDRAGENFKCECGMNRLSPHFAKIHLPCDVHKTSTCVNNMFKLVENTITGIVNLGLMFRPGGTLRQFHQCIQDEICLKLRVIVGPPPDGYIQKYRNEVYELFLGKNFSNQDVKKKQQLLRIRQVQTLNYFLNGDIQCEDEIVWYAPFEIEIEDARALLCKYVPYALLPACVAIFPRHRWHGCEIPIDQLGLVAAHHGLLKHACLRFLNQISPQKSSEVVERSASGWNVAALRYMKAADEMQPIQDIANANASEGPSDPVGPSGDPDQGQNQKPQSWEDFNRSVRARVRHFISQDHDVSILPLLRFACSPILGFMFQCLKVSSEAWDDQQAHVTMTTGKRSYRILEAFLGTYLEEVFIEFSNRMHCQIPALPLKAHVRQNCVLLFCLIARASSALHFLIRKIRSGFPYKLFGCLDGKSSDVVNSPRCLYDPLTHAFMEVFGPVGLDSKEANAMLHTLAEMALVDIASVESRHATIRRALEAASVQTWRATLEKLSADFSCRQSNGWRNHFARRLFVPTNPKKKGVVSHKQHQRRNVEVVGAHIVHT